MKIHKEVTLKKVTIEELEQLQSISQTTFLQAFEADNDPGDMKAYVEEAFSLAQLKKELEHPESRFFFALHKNQVIGYLKVNWGAAQTEHPLEHAMELQRIYVLADFHGHKIGQLLMDKTLEIAREEKMASIWLGVWEENIKAVRFYKKNGFEVFGTHQFLLGEDLQTDLVMKLDLQGFFIRQLKAEDAEAFQNLKLSGLKEAPFAFSDSYEDEKNKSQSFFLEEFSQFIGHPERFVLGAFDLEEQLKGYVIFKRDQRSNARHKSMIHNMYVHTDLRTKGAGRALLNAVMDRGSRMAGLEQIHLWVLHSDQSASGFYKKMGFISQGPLVKKDQKIQGRYVDAEYMVYFFSASFIDQSAQYP